MLIHENRKDPWGKENCWFVIEKQLIGKASKVLNAKADASDVTRNFAYHYGSI